jgi:hypothetical protein
LVGRFNQSQSGTEASVTQSSTMEVSILKGSPPRLAAEAIMMNVVMTSGML